MAMLYQNRVTGGLVEVVSQHGEGILMCLDANEEVFYINEEDLVPHLDIWSRSAMKSA